MFDYELVRGEHEEISDGEFSRCHHNIYIVSEAAAPVTAAQASRGRGQRIPQLPLRCGIVIIDRNSAHRAQKPDQKGIRKQPQLLHNRVHPTEFNVAARGGQVHAEANKSGPLRDVGLPYGKPPETRHLTLYILIIRLSAEGVSLPAPPFEIN